MALFRRNKIWWIQLCHKGRRIQQSTGTSNKTAAKKYLVKLQTELWETEKLGHKPDYLWQDAVVRWLQECKHKRSIDCDIMHLRWLDKYFKNLSLHELSRDRIEQVALAKEAEGVKPATVNRMLEVVRAILRKALNEWEWLNRIPYIRMRHEETIRIRWLTVAEAQKLMLELPKHSVDMVVFTLATGLRASNVKGLKWAEINLEKRHAWIHPDQAKAKKAIPVPLNEDAMSVLQKRKSMHPEYVFTYRNQPISECNTKAWRKALKRAGIMNFRWHDLRHTWASWHVQKGTSLQELQQLGGWSSFEMVLRYAHLSNEHLKSAAERVTTNLLHGVCEETQKVT